MIPLLPRSRRPAPLPGLAAGYRVYGPTAHGDSSQQEPGRLPSWPENWHRSHPLDPVVFGAVPCVGVHRIGLR